MFVRKSLGQAVYLLAVMALILTACNMGATPAPTVDVNAINTAAVATAMGQLSAQFTQTALAAPTATSIPTQTAVTLPSPASNPGGVATLGTPPTVSFNSTPIVGNTTPLAGFTPFSTVAPAGGPTTSLGDSCNNAAFVADVTVPDNEVLKAGTDVQKIWSVKNTGTCTWDEGYKLVQFAGSPDLGKIQSYEIGKNGNDNNFVTAGSTANLGVWIDVPCKVGKYEAHFRMQSDSGYFFGTVLSVYFEVQEKCK
jgi:hypothetical protein